MIDFPLIKTFHVNSRVISFLNRKYEEYRLLNQLRPAENEIYMSDTGLFTDNLLEWKDKEYQKFAKNKLVTMVSKQLRIDKKQFSMYWTHIFDYQKGGYVREHKHDDVEDYVMLLHLNKCSSGETIFYLNNYDEEAKNRTTIRVMPLPNRGVCFSSQVMHKVSYTQEPKRILAAGIKINVK